MPTVGYATLQIIPSVRGIGNELRQQLVGPADDAGTAAGDAAGGSLREKLLLGAAAAGAAAGALLVAGITEAMEQASITKTLQAQLGATGQDAERYGTIAGQLYAKGITENVQQGADVIRSIVNAGLVPPDATNKQLKTIATRMADVANTFGTDMSMQTQAVAAMMKNRLAPDAQSALDVITVGMQKLGPNAEDLLETFQEYSVQLRKLGLDSEEALGLFRQGIQGGARDTDIIADAFKEFSIRAVDMSTTSRDAYKALGLDAKAMEAQIGQGGESAQRGLQTVLDKLREMKDPVEREAAAVGLFGTQAEDMGAALFALDPGRATAVFDDVSGSAKRLGDTLHSGPMHEIEVFARTLKQGFVTVIGNEVLPVIKDLASWTNDNLVPAIGAAADVVSGIIGWFREWGVWLAPLAILIGGVTLALNAQAIATGLVTAVFSVYRAAILAGTAVTSGFAAAQALLNSVMALNPFVLIAIAVVALGAALVIAWKKSETFRSIVMGAWQGIQTAAMWAWNNILKPAIDGLVRGWQWVANGAMSLWQTIKPVLSWIGTALKVVATIAAVIVFGPMILGFKVLAATATWLWSAVLKPVIGWIVAGFNLWWAGVKLYFNLVMAGFRAVGAAATWLWRNAISPVIGWIVAGFKLWWSGVKLYFGLVMTGLRTVGGWFKWLWSNAVKPVWGWIVTAAKVAWSGIETVFGYFMTGLRTVGDWFKWLYDNVVKPVWTGIKTTISTVWNSGIKPAFDAVKRAASAVGDAFKKAKDYIGEQWSKLSGIAKEPIAFVINTVYNKGIVPVWNTVAKAFGAPTLNTLPGFATGGVLPGYTPGRDVHLAALSGGEAIMRPEWTRAVGPGYVHAMNAAARSGGVAGVQRALGLPGFADGGIFDWVKGAASKGIDLAKAGVSWLKDGIKASATAGLNSIVKPLIEKISGSASLYRQMITGIPKRMLKEIVNFSGKADRKLEAAGIGGKGFKAGLAWARTQHGKRYQWGGNGDPSWDCSGFLSAIESVIRGQKPHRRWATGAFSGATAPPGWVKGAKSPYMIGITNAGVGHTAGTLNGVNVESRGGDGVVVGRRARSYRDSLFTDVYGFKGYAAGGRPRPGELAWVGEHGPELVRFRGGETVYDHRTSMAMTEGLYARGFAKGTASAARVRASARRDLPADLGSFTKALKGGAGLISKATKTLTDDLKVAGGAGRALAASTTKASAKLQTMAARRDSIAATMATAREAAAEQKRTAADFLSLSNLSGATSVTGLLKQMSRRQSTVANFQSYIRTLSGRGLDKGLISQLVAMGPDSTMAQLLAGATGEEIARLNAFAKSGTKLSASYGTTMADAMYDAGRNASKGFLTGLQSEQKALQAAMNSLGDSLVKSIKRKLRIKSPSRVTRLVGEQTGQGMVIGLDATASRVAAAAGRVADAAVPAVAPAGLAARAAGGLQPGQPVLLQLEDGPLIRGWVRTIADESTDARNRELVSVLQAGRRRG